MKKSIFLIITSAAVGLLSASAGVDCVALSLSVKSAVKAEQSKVLEIVSAEVASAPDCACEIVKAAIEASNANAQTVAAIVEAAVVAAPEQMRLVSQCAVAVAPDALDEVQAVLAKLDPNLGDSGSSSKDSKDSKDAKGEVASAPNPLDFPGTGTFAPPPHDRFRVPPLDFNLPPFVIAPPDVSNINP